MSKLYKFKAEDPNVNVKINNFRIVDSEYIGHLKDIESFTPNFDQDRRKYTVEELPDDYQPEAAQEPVEQKPSLAIKGAMSTGDLVAKAKAVLEQPKEQPKEQE